MKNHRKAIFVAVGLGIMAYLMATVADWLFFFDQSFWAILISNVTPHRLFMHLMYLFCLMLFCVYAIFLLAKLQRTREREAHIKRVVLAIRNVNRLITHEKDQTRLLDEACRLLIDTRGFYNAWIVLVEDGRPVEPFYHMGFDGKFGEMTRRLLSGDLPLCGRRVLKEKRLQVICNPVEECDDCPNRPIGNPDHAELSVPLKYEETVLGWLTVSAPRTFSLDPEEQQLLIEVADDLAFALQNIRGHQALQKSQERYQEIFEHMSDGVAVYDAIDDGRDFVFKDINPAVARGGNYSREGIIGRRVADVFPGVHGIGLFEIFQRVYRTGRAEHLPIRQYEDDRVSLWVENYVFKLISGEVVAIYADKTEGKQAEAERERLLSAVEQSREIFVITDADGAIQYVNPAFTEITGYSREEVLGQNPRILKSGQQDDAFYQKLWQTISSGKSWQGRFVNKRKDGTIYTEEATISPIRNQSGRITNYAGVKHDITGQLQIHNEKLQLEAQFQQAQKLESIGRLAGGVAHDLNNLLSPIIGYSEILMDDAPEGSDQRESLEGIIQAGMRARDLVGQLLAFSSKQILEFRPVDLNQILSWFEKLLRRTIREDVSIIIRPSPSLPLIRGDAGQLEQVIMNLMVNAQDAMPDGGEISIATSETELTDEASADLEDVIPGQYVVLSISDTGCGMDAGVLEHLFEPFFTTKEKGKGTGLGLATAYGIIKQHNGGIRVTSQPGQGTTFNLFLPVTHESSVEEETGATASIDLQGAETILLVEDDEQVRVLSDTVLRRQGYTVIAAEDGASALTAAEQHPGAIHLLLTDVIMPNMNGRELFEQISRKRSPVDGNIEMKVIYMSGYADDIIARHGVLEKGVNFIQKPFSVEALALKVRNVLDGK